MFPGNRFLCARGKNVPPHAQFGEISVGESRTLRSLLRTQSFYSVANHLPQLNTYLLKYIGVVIGPNRISSEISRKFKAALNN